VSLLSVPAEAQYFGRNKVQYKDFKFEVLKTDHFDIYFYEDERQSAARVGRMAERWYARLSSIFEHEIKTRQPLVLYASHPDFEQTNVVGGMIGEGTGGVTEGMKRRVVLPLAGTLAETDHVLGHELVHAFQYDIAENRARGKLLRRRHRSPAALVRRRSGRVPFDWTGRSSYGDVASRCDPQGSAAADQRSQQRRILPYRWGQAVWAYIGGKYGDDLIGRIFESAVSSGDAITALEESALINAKELSTNWHADIRSQYAPVMSATARAHTFGRSLTATDKTRMATNVSPSISPDGKHIVFFSSRDLFSIDLYLAETATGRIVRKLVDTAQNSHFTSLQFISSAGSWSPNSRQFVVGGVHAGKAVLAILNIADGDVAREIEVPQVGEILNPTWSPNGKSIAFSATVGGIPTSSSTTSLLRRTRDRPAPFDGSRATCMQTFSPRGRPTETPSRLSPTGSPRTKRRSTLATIDSRFGMLRRAASRRSRRSARARTSTRNGHQTAATCSSCPIRTGSAISIASTCSRGRWRK
jgi:hypothetical protein